MPTTLTRPLRFNHVAMSVTPDELTEASRADIADFYGDVFGWTELDVMTEDRHRLVLSCGTVEQFVYIIAEDVPMQAPRLDHFGLSVATLEDFDAVYERALAWRDRDPRVDLIEKKTENLHDAVEMTSFYVKFLLPMMVEIQHWKFLR